MECICYKNGRNMYFVSGWFSGLVRGLVSGLVGGVEYTVDLLYLTTSLLYFVILHCINLVDSFLLLVLSFTLYTALTTLPAHINIITRKTLYYLNPYAESI